MAQYSIWVLEANSVTGLPAESTGGPGGYGSADGAPPYTLTVTNANWIEIVVEDSQDNFFNEPTNANAANYGSQTIVNPVTLNGVTYAAGLRIFTAYDLTNTTTGLQITTFHINANDGQLFAGPVQGLVSYGPLPPGTYTFDDESTSANANNLYSDSICFCKGTHILTADGERRVETLSVGDMIQTRDHGLQEIRWIGSTYVRGHGRMAPIKISKGALNQRNDADAIPARDLFVSPQHRMLITDWRAEVMFWEPSVLSAAKHLINDTSIRPVDMDQVEYFHILFDAHEIVFAEGAPSESFHPGEQGMGAIDLAARQEILELFPELATQDHAYRTLAYPELKSHEGNLTGACR